MTETQVAGGISAAATDTGTVVTLWGEVDAALRDQASVAMTTLVGADGPIAVDVRRVEFIDSSGLAFILQVYMIGQEAGIDVTLRDPSRELEDLLEMIGMGGQIPVERTAPVDA
ncbi:anti-anti-sigma factor [Sediminihabitans luteus]|uniref:Anti-anti-sigma factor n=1 Tax=Sediminihabitans luteus TaxID=1138585 RepID=A0A2M9CD21_9CELL|nr:STAS domain-containing protein [Sediminihabitans luteus]PJJ69285.1 anti-anti-sigma factor [Sediminihabitans luteus]GII98967.1 hypothetical protein Slu03_13450 [Sediminihabitans luteus]